MFLGVLISYTYNYKPGYLKFIEKYRVTMWVVTVVLIGINYCLKRQDNLWEPVVMLALNPLVFGMFIVLCLNHIKGLPHSMLITIGRCSYSIYLWHFFFADFLVRVYARIIQTANFNKIPFLNTQIVYFTYVCVYIACSIGFGILTSRLIEEPFLKLRDKYFPSKTRQIIANIP